jgi:integrase/recombinase XerD
MTMERRYKTATVKSYVNKMKAVLIADTWADKNNYQQVNLFLEQLNQKPLEFISRQHILIALKRYYDYMVESGQREDHPCRNLNLKGQINKSIIHADLFIIAELEPIVQFQTRGKRIRTCFQTVASLLVYQGLTAPEITRLKVSDIDLEQGVIHVKAGQMLTSRTLDMKPSQFNLISRYINQDRKKHFKPTNDNLLYSLHGTDIQEDNIRNYLESFRMMYPGRSLSARTIRDSVISYCLNDLKFPIDQVQLLAGHRWLTSTERYIRASKLEDREMLKQFHPLG